MQQVIQVVSAAATGMRKKRMSSVNAVWHRRPYEIQMTILALPGWTDGQIAKVQCVDRGSAGSLLVQYKSDLFHELSQKPFDV